MATSQPVIGQLLEDKNELHREYLRRSKPEVRDSQPRTEPIPEGWTEKPTRYKNTRWIVRPKRMGEQLEDDTWCLFHLMGMNRMNTRFFTLHFRDVYDPKTKQTIPDTQQVDVVAVHDQNVFVVECKSKVDLGTKKVRQVILDMDDRRNDYKRALTQILGFQPRIILVLATANIELDPRDLAKAHEKGIVVWNSGDVSALLQLAKMAGEGARYQFYGTLFRGKKMPEAGGKVAALRAKMGGHAYYSFVLRPEQLLKIAYVHSRSGSSFRDVTDAYQRMLEAARLKKVQSYIETGGFFPGSIILNFDRKLQYEPLLDKKKGQMLDDSARAVMLTLPNEYGSAWVIDGQHRLYGFADSDWRSSETLPVVAFEAEGVSFQAKVFVDINKNQKAVDPNLLWDLYEDLYSDSTDEKELELRTISLIAKRLAGEKYSPFYKRIHIPKEGNTDAPLNLRAVCHSIKGHGLVNPKLGRLFCNNWEETVDYAAQRIAAFYNGLAKPMPKQWALGDGHFICTKTAFITLTGLLADLVNQNMPPAKLANLPKFRDEVNGVLAPLVTHLLDQDATTIASYRKVGGAEGGTSALRAAFTEIIDIKSDFLTNYNEDGSSTLIAADSVMPYLKNPEGPHLEFKGALTLNLRKYVHTGEIDCKSNDHAGEGVLKAIVGFLNAQGGEVVIGVAEARLMEGAQEDILADAREEDGLYVIGVQIEYDKFGSDGFQLKLQNMIKDRIGADVAAGLVEVRHLKPLDDRELWAVAVKPSHKRQYLDGQRFYVRTGNQTIEMKGPEADEYWASRAE